MDRIDHYDSEVTIGVVGKYVGLPDAYKSLREALVHGGIANRAKVKIQWIDAELFEHPEADVVAELEPLHGILVPGGFGERGSEGKIASVKFARERDIPFFGICLGMQMACIEGGAEPRRDQRSLDDRVRSDSRAGGGNDHRMDERGRACRSARPTATSAGPCGSAPIPPSSTATASSVRSTGRTTISERHRHRYEVNIHYRDALERAGLLFSGMSPDDQLPEIVERPDHPWFIGVQFHPELKSRPFAPHPLVRRLHRGGAEAEQAGLGLGGTPLRLDRYGAEPHQEESPMLLTIAIILLILWALGFFLGHFGALVHLLLVVGIIVLIWNFVAGRRGV